jgi:hypothetical protein
MFARVLAIGLFVWAAVGVVAVSDTAEAAAPAAKKKVKNAAAKKKAKAKKKAQPLDTVALFKKLDTNSDQKLDLDEFKNLLTVQPVPKGKKKQQNNGPIDPEFTFKSLDANGDKTLSVDEFKGVVPAVYPAPKK